MTIFPVVVERRMTRRAFVSLCFLRRSVPITTQTRERENKRLSLEGNDKMRKVCVYARTDAHLEPRGRTLTVRRELEHLRLDRVRRLLILLALALALPTVEPRRRPREPILLLRSLR